jgi:hypothetical protein
MTAEVDNVAHRAGRDPERQDRAEHAQETYAVPIHHHLPFWWDVAAIAVFSLAVFYYAVHSRLSPDRTAVNVGEAVAGAEQEELALEVEPG